MNDERKGMVVKSRLPLRPGSNAVVAVAPVSSQSTETKLQLLARSLGAGIGVQPQYAGKRLSYQFWVIGDARPVVLRLMGTTPRLMKWYDRVGASVGPEPEFYSVNIDWRGPSRLLVWPADIFVFPLSPKTVHGEANYPDSGVEGFKEMLSAARTDKWIVEAGAEVDKHVERGLGILGSVGTAVVGVGAALGALWVILRAKK